MAAQSLQQIPSKARHIFIARIASVSIALALLIVGVLAYRSATGPRNAARVANPPAATALLSPAIPAQWSTGSAYDGGAYGSVRAPAAATTRSPIRHAGSSAYDGGAYTSAHKPARNAYRSPIQGTGSAYDGGASGSVLPVAAQRVRDIPALHSTGSAYDGQ